MMNVYDHDDRLLPAADRAVILAVEKHPKQTGMYRLLVRLPDPDSEMFLTVHEDTLVSMRLLKGRSLTADEWERLLNEQQLEEAYRAALIMLERKARTSKELTEALKRKGFSEDAISGAITRLKKSRMLDDAAYARRFAEQRVAWQRKGSLLVRHELLQRGISKEEADQALQALDSGIEQEMALQAARKKWPQIKGGHYEKKMKLAAFLLRRGYPQSVAKSAAERVAAEAEITDDGSE